MNTSSTIPASSVAWRAVQERDRSFDGRFVYGVSSTHIFCRPSCSSRRPTRSRVEFFPSPADAMRAGYRACKRCRPASEDNGIERVVAYVADILAHTEGRVTLDELGRRAGFSAFHLQRVFKRTLGISPRQYQDAVRRRQLSARLRSGDTVSRATYAAGFGSSSRVYERHLGMTPATIRRGGAGQRIQFSIVPCSLGRLLVAYTEKGVCAVAIGDDDGKLERQFRDDFPKAEIHAAGATIHEWITAIVRGLEGAPVSTRIPLDVQGTAFQWRVWTALQQIPRGTTLSYSDVAKRIGQPTAVRAVARACATNPVALVIPCHRVVRETGELGGYRWGLERKRALLDGEQNGRPG